MFIGASEGDGWRYEIVERTEGYVVQARDLDTGVLDADEGKLFRAAATAFAYAEMSAALDRYASSRFEGEEAEAPLVELETQQALYHEISRRLGDVGAGIQVLTAWEESDEARLRRRYH